MDSSIRLLKKSSPPRFPSSKGDIEPLLYNLHYDQSKQLSQTNKTINTMLKEESFWKSKAYYDFKISSHRFDNLTFQDTTLNTPENKYIYFLTFFKNDFVKGSEIFLSPKQFTRMLLRLKKYDLINYAIYKNVFVWKIGLIFFAEEGDIYHFDLVYEKSKRYPLVLDWTLIAFGALSGNNIHMLEHIRRLENVDMNRLILASRSIEMFDYILSLLPIENRTFKWSIMLSHAISIHREFHNHVSILLPLPRIINGGLFAHNLLGSIDVDNLKYVELRTRGGGRIIDYQELAEDAVGYKNITLIEYITQNHTIDFTPLIKEAFDRRFATEIIKIATGTIRWEEALVISYNNPTYYQSVIESIPVKERKKIDWNQIITAEQALGNQAIAELIRTHYIK
jgi:hypothetical protein